MTWTYGGDPANDLVDAVRYRIQDVDEDRPLIEDQEIEYELVEADNDVLQAALSCAEALLAKGAHRVTKKIGDRSINYSDLAGQYEKLVTVLQSKIQRGDYSYTVPTIGAVADVANYPTEFEPTDIAGPDWSEEE